MTSSIDSDEFMIEEVKNEINILSGCKFSPRTPEVVKQRFQVQNTAGKINGKILVADDQMINLEVIRTQLEELSLLDRSEFFHNGEDIFNAVKAILSSATEDSIFNENV